MNYQYMTYPLIREKGIQQLTKEEAKEYFRYYISQIPSRIEQLSRIYEELGGGKKEDLDHSKESLIPIWKWYMNNAEIVELTEEEFDKKRAMNPEFTWEFLSDKKVTPLWLSISVIDMAMYFAECFLKYYPQILKWDVFLGGKSYVYYNRPVLKGFFRNKIPMDPSRLLHVLTLKLVDGKSDEMALFDLFEVWENKYIKSCL